MKFTPPAAITQTLLANSNVTLAFTLPATFGYDELDNYVPITTTTLSYSAIVHNDSKPLEDAFYGTDNKGEWLRGRLTNPLTFDSKIVHLTEVSVTYSLDDITRKGILYLPTPNPYTLGKMGQSFNILLSLNDI